MHNKLQQEKIPKHSHFSLFISTTKSTLISHSCEELLCILYIQGDPHLSTKFQMKIDNRENANRKRKCVSVEDRLEDEEEAEVDEEDGIFKSKNLFAERKRRKKLNDRQLELRSLVPIITNMTKATIITDAITYIEKLKNTVEELTRQLQEMEAIPCSVDDKEEMKLEEIDSERETTKKYGNQPEVEVSHICGTKLWIKVLFRKKKGSLTKLIEAINLIGYDLTDTSISTSSGTVLFTSSAEKTVPGITGSGEMDVDQIRRFLLEITKSF